MPVYKSGDTRAPGYRRRARVTTPRARREATADAPERANAFVGVERAREEARRGEDAARRGRITEEFGDVDLARIVGGRSRNRRRGAR